ncbi:MAG: 50S ribosomal protein L5 [Clostridiales bacterium]|nr:50S ribosomal protein L5 [Clostridiales bacterium]
MMRLEERYKKEVCPAMLKKFKYKNVMQIPKIVKVVINMGVGDAKENSKAIENASSDLAKIVGQKPVVTKAKVSVAAFKLRRGMNIGCKVTLRKHLMYEFIDRLINIAVPRVRDFRGINPNSFDGRGNYCFGIKEHIVFPEIEYDKIDKIRGMDIVFVTSALNDKEAKELFTFLGFPFKS